MTVRIGLTGSIGAGKSTVARMLRSWGVEVVDADELAREAMRDEGVLAQLSQAFGDVVVGREVDRARLARTVFADPGARTRLESIVHPVVHRLRREREAVATQRPDPPPVIVHDVPLLYEAKIDREMDAVIVVDAPWELRLERLKARSGWTDEQAWAREATQLPAAEKRARADVVVDNDDDEAVLERRVREAFEDAVKLAMSCQGLPLVMK